MRLVLAVIIADCLVVYWSEMKKKINGLDAVVVLGK